MVSSNDFKNGMTILYDGHMYKILEFMHVKPGKGGAFVRTKLRDLRSGAVVDVTFNAAEKVERAIIDKVAMQYLYDSGDALVFMDNETYEQIEIPHALVEYEKQFLVENMTVSIEKFGEEILGVNLPDKVTLKVTKCDPAVRGDTKTNALKDAYVETGLLVKVPMFIEEGESIIVSTETGKYSSRA
ncbi:MAG TPA: elongation factor P [Candidatus Pelethenecus faecipullorum]|uniref:Elongation factor P n=1 Tax=Candidatus Pelethenecus faecipullorum TaxID=2840900 RepID=A0A9D1GPV8_9MOLU|nr:elongation factor P [Candidatus Pelethenecus faecipullorum]